MGLSNLIKSLVVYTIFHLESSYCIVDFRFFHFAKVFQTLCFLSFVRFLVLINIITVTAYIISFACLVHFHIISRSLEKQPTASDGPDRFIGGFLGNVSNFSLEFPLGVALTNTEVGIA